MIPITNSSNVSHIGYDPATNSLKVLYANGGTYHYSDVEPEHWDNIQAEMANGGSVGKYLATHIKAKDGDGKARYAFEKIPVDESA